MGMVGRQGCAHSVTSPSYGRYDGTWAVHWYRRIEVNYYNSTVSRWFIFLWNCSREIVQAAYNGTGTVQWYASTVALWHSATVAYISLVGAVDDVVERHGVQAVVPADLEHQLLLLPGAVHVAVEHFAEVKLAEVPAQGAAPH